MARDRIELVKEFLAKIGCFDMEAVRGFLAEDAVMTFPYLDQLPDITGRDAIVEQIESTVPVVMEAMNFTFTEFHPTADPDCLIAEYTSKCPLRGSDGFYENEYIAVFKFRGDEITLYKEYLDPTRMAVHAEVLGDELSG